jgi:RHS repeat-associated protein
MVKRIQRIERFKRIFVTQMPEFQAKNQKNLFKSFNPFNLFYHSYLYFTKHKLLILYQNDVFKRLNTSFFEMYKNGMGPLLWKEQHLYGSARLGMQRMEKGMTGTMQAEGTGFNGVQTQHGQKSYELSNHLGNVMAVISDRGVLQSAQDYYLFGMSMPGRSSGSYRYTFNGKETDPETGIQDYGMRWYLPNIARFPSVDPLTAKYPFYTPYQFAGNMPIQFIDLDGCEPADPESKLIPRPEYDAKNGEGGQHFSTSDGCYYVLKQGETYNWAKVGDTQWNPDANWKPTNYIDTRPIGIPEQATDNKWRDMFYACTNTKYKLPLNFAKGTATVAGYIGGAGVCSGVLEAGIAVSGDLLSATWRGGIKQLGKMDVGSAGSDLINQTWINAQKYMNTRIEGINDADKTWFGAAADGFKNVNWISTIGQAKIGGPKGILINAVISNVSGVTLDGLSRGCVTFNQPDAYNILTSAIGNSIGFLGNFSKAYPNLSTFVTANFGNVFANQAQNELTPTKPPLNK